MSYYYKYNFISPEATYALVKEEMKSYFDTGAVDDVLFPIYTKKCLDKLGKSSYAINHAILRIEDYSSRLPDGFLAVREAWSCTGEDQSYRLPGAHYNQIIQTSVRLDQPDYHCDVCSACENPEIIRAIYKTTKEVLFTVKRTHLLRPGNISVRNHCTWDCANYGSTSVDMFDIRDNKFITNFSEGVVYLVFYEEQYMENGYQLVPDNVRVLEYIEATLKYKIYEQLCNIVTDETYRQIEAKKAKAEADMYEKQVLAEIEVKKETIHDKARAIKKVRTRHDKYNIR